MAAKKKTQKPAPAKQTPAKQKVEKKILPAEIKAMNKKLTEKNKFLQELRAQKKSGKDVKKEIKEALKFLKENRAKKQERIKELKL